MLTAAFGSDEEAALQFRLIDSPERRIRVLYTGGRPKPLSRCLVLRSLLATGRSYCLASLSDSHANLVLWQVPSLFSLPLVKYMLPKDGSGAGAHGAYGAIVPLDGKVIVEWYQCVRRVYEAEGFDAMCDFFMHGRHAVFICMLCFDKTNRQQTDAINRMFHKLFQEGSKRGFSDYRTHVNHMGESGIEG